MFLQQVSRPQTTGTLPIPLTDVKAHLNIDWDEDDTRLTNLVWSAVDFIERETGRNLIATTWKEVHPYFFRYPNFTVGYPSYFTIGYPYFPYFTTGYPGNHPCIMLTKSPVSSVTSVTYYDNDNVLQTLATSEYYAALPTNKPASLTPITNWPPTFCREDAVTIQYVCNYGRVPDAALHAIRLLVGSWNENRESEVVGLGLTQSIVLSHGLERLLDQIRYFQYN